MPYASLVLQAGRELGRFMCFVEPVDGLSCLLRARVSCMAAPRSIPSRGTSIPPRLLTEENTPSGDGYRWGGLT